MAAVGRRLPLLPNVTKYLLFERHNGLLLVKVRSSLRVVAKSGLNIRLRQNILDWFDRHAGCADRVSPYVNFAFDLFLLLFEHVVNTLVNIRKCAWYLLL